MKIHSERRLSEEDGTGDLICSGALDGKIGFGFSATFSGTFTWFFSSIGGIVDFSWGRSFSSEPDFLNESFFF